MSQLSLLANWTKKAAVIASVCTLVFAPGATTMPALAETAENNSQVYKLAEEELPEQFYILYRIVERIARANEIDNSHWRVVIPEEYEINAFAQEANLLVIYNGLLDQLEGDVSALACVVGHEMAHHYHQHIPIYHAEYDEGLEEISESTSESEAIDPDYPDESNDDSEKLEERMAELKRNQEYEADAYGYRYSVRAGFEPEGCIRALGVLSRLPGSLRDSHSHPAVPARVEAIQKLTQEETPEWLKMVGSREFDSSPALTFKWSEEDQSLRINSQRGGSFVDDFDRLFSN